MSSQLQLAPRPVRAVAAAASACGVSSHTIVLADYLYAGTRAPSESSCEGELVVSPDPGYVLSVGLAVFGEEAGVMR